MNDPYRQFSSVDALLERVLRQPPRERSSFLSEVGREEPELREAAERLLKAVESDTAELGGNQQWQELFERVFAGTVHANSEGEPKHAQHSDPVLELGQRFGSYQVLEMIGAGGMGQVYRARDARLDRDVALKVLPMEFADDAERLARFEREAKLLASLDHPNINRIHELAVDGARRALVLEYVEGQTLAERLVNEPFKIEEALRIASQIALALDSAHEAGILHRDLKPSNIKLTPSGQVKVLDFGLAKSISQGNSGDEPLDSSLTDMTRAGAILGTAPYMSPEQWRGHRGDKRADLWAFGCILFEMLSGHRPFSGEARAEVAAAILEREPSWQLLPAGVPGRLLKLLRSCLKKDHGERIGSTQELLDQIAAVSRQWSRPRWHVATLRVALSSVTLVLVIGGLLAIRDRVRDRVTAELPVSGPASTTASDVSMAPRPIDSVLILAFENIGLDSEDEYLSLSIPETLINTLSRTSSLRVVPRSVAFSHDLKTTDPLSVARDLGVKSVVTGRVMERGGELIVAAELMDVEAVSHLWGKQFERPLQGIVTLQRDLAREITSALRIEVALDVSTAAAAADAANPEAYRLNLKAKHELGKLTTDGLDQALLYAEEAVVLNPDYALTWSMLAWIWDARAQYGMEPYYENGLKIKEATARSLTLDPLLPLAHVNHGYYLARYEWDWQGALDSYERALELDPLDAESNNGYADVLLAMGRFQEALHYIERSVELEPLDAHFLYDLGRARLGARQYDDAIAAFEEVLDINPTNEDAIRFIPEALSLLGRHDEAIRRHHELSPRLGEDLQSRPRLAYLHAVAGHIAEARRLLSTESRAEYYESSAPRTTAWGPLFALARALAELGDSDEAFVILEELYDQRASMFWWQIGPQWDAFRSDPRWKDLAQRVGIPP